MIKSEMPGFTNLTEIMHIHILKIMLGLIRKVYGMRKIYSGTMGISEKQMTKYKLCFVAFTLLFSSILFAGDSKSSHKNSKYFIGIGARWWWRIWRKF